MAIVLTAIVFHLDVASLEKAQIAVSPSGHYIAYGDETLMLIGDSGTQVVMQNVNIDYRQWIDECAARGIRAVHVWSFMAPRQKQDGSLVEARFGYVYPGITPWKRAASGPLATDQLPRWDLTAFDEGPEGDATHYWPRLRDLCGYAKKKNIIVGYTVFTGWMKGNGGAWPYHPFNEVNGGHLTTFPDAGVTIESPGTEVWQQEWNEAWPDTRKTQWIWERFAKKAIDDLASLGNVFFVYYDEHSYTEGNMGDHFAEFFRSRGAWWVDWSARRGQVDMVYDQHLLTKDGDRGLAGQFNKHPVRPFVGLEEGGTSGFNYTSDLLHILWRYTTAGGHFFHHNDAEQETETTGVMIYDPHVTPAGDEDQVFERLSWLGNASQFFNTHVKNLDALKPNHGFVGKDFFCLADPGREYVVYAPETSPEQFTLDLSDLRGPFAYRFYNPYTGEFLEAVRETSTPILTLVKPNPTAWVLHLFSLEH